MLVRILVLLLVGACGKPWMWDVWPLTPELVSKSTHSVTGVSEDGARVIGAAFVVANHHLVTSESICMTAKVDSLFLDVRGKHLPATMDQIDQGLCLVKTAASLDHALIIARTMPSRDGTVSYVAADGSTRQGHRISRSEISAPWRSGLAGSPVIDGCGVVGVLIGPRVSGQPGARLVTLGALQRLLGASDVDYQTEPELDVPPEASAPRAHLSGDMMDPSPRRSCR